MRPAYALIPALALALFPFKAAADEPERIQWTLGVSEIPPASVSSLDSSAQAALSSLPSMVLERIRDLDRRFLTEEEKRMRRERELLSSLYSSGAEAASIRDKRDSAALSPNPVQMRASEERKLGEELFEKKKALVDPESAVPGEVPDETSILLWSGHRSEQFLADSRDPGYVCRKEKIDYLILWEVDVLGGFFKVRMEGWNAALGRSDFQHTAYCPVDDVESCAGEFAGAVISAAVSRLSSRIVLRVEPAGARVFLDGRQLAPGRHSLRIFEAREYRIRAEAAGYRPEEITLSPVLGKDTEAVFKLVPYDEARVAVRTDPPGAFLYLDGIWAGTTPISIPSYLMARSILLQCPGYEDLFAVLDPRKSMDAAFTLEKEAEGTTTALERRKKQFYNSLGYLVVSLPVAIISYGVFHQNNTLYGEHPENEDFLGRRNLSGGCFAAAAGITGAFLVNAAIRLFLYIKSAR